MAKLIRLHAWMLLAVILYVPAVRGQQTDAAKDDSRDQPLAPSASLLSSGSTGDSALGLSEAPITETQVAGDDRPISGVQELVLGPNVGVRNFLVPSVSV